MPEIGMSYKTEEADDRLAPFLDTPPAFRRLFKKDGTGMPTMGSVDLRRTPSATAPWWSHKDFPDVDDLAQISTVWSQLAALYPDRKIRWTFQHEGNENHLGTHRLGWKALAMLRANHPARDQIFLTTIIGGYYARFKSMGRWRDWVMEDLVQGIAFDLYAPTDRPTYEDPASILGIVDQAMAEYGKTMVDGERTGAGLEVGVAEFGSTLIGKDLGTIRAQWFGDCISHAVRNRYHTFGLWASSEMRDGLKYDYRPRDSYTQISWQGAFKRWGGAVRPGEGWRAAPVIPA